MHLASQSPRRLKRLLRSSVLLGASREIGVADMRFAGILALRVYIALLQYT